MPEQGEARGNRVNIPEPEHGYWPSGVQCGNANELGDVGSGGGLLPLAISPLCPYPACFWLVTRPCRGKTQHTWCLVIT